MRTIPPLIDTQAFLALSAFLNYQLSAEPISWRGILNLVAGERQEGFDAELLLEALAYLETAYGEQKRRLGPLAILHPIRVAALLIRAEARPSTLDLLTTLFHDKNEDLTPDRYGRESWQKLESTYQAIAARIRNGSPAALDERLALLARKEDERYYQYLGRLIRNGGPSPVLIEVKLADRLDNTLDLRIDLADFSNEMDCYQVIFEILFVHTYRGIDLRQPHPVGRKINGAARLYQLYKNAVFLSLLRDEKTELGAAGRRLFSALAMASIAEAQSTMLHLFAYHLQDPLEQQDLLRSVMSYSEAGGLRHINLGEGHHLDGLFKRRFDREDRDERRQSLEELYRDKRLMGETAVAFIAIFTNFLNDPEFTIRGISAAGIAPPPPL